MKRRHPRTCATKPGGTGGTAVSLGDYATFLMAAIKAQQTQIEGQQIMIEGQRAMIEEKDFRVAEMQTQLMETMTRTRELEARMNLLSQTRKGGAR